MTEIKNIPEEITDILDGPEQECYPLCQKGMTKDTCPYNPNLGCDCGANPAYKQLDRPID